MNRHQKTIMGCLRDGDVSIRRRALDLLFIMCTPSNSVRCIDERYDDRDQALAEALRLSFAM